MRAYVYACLTATVLMLIPGLPSAADLWDVAVTQQQGRYRVVAEMFVRAPQEQAFAALVDYDRFAQLSDSYVQSRYLEPAADGTPRVFTRVEGCVLFFCRGIERSARLRAEPLDLIVATVEKKSGGQLAFGEESWRLRRYADGTAIRYRHEIEFAIWIPPVIGPWAIRKVLNRAALAAAQVIEDMALSGNYTQLESSPCCAGAEPSPDQYGGN